MKKRILCFDQGEHIGGAEIFFSELLGKLSDDYEIHLITGYNPKYLKKYNQKKIYIHSTELPSLRPWKLRSYFKSQRKIAEFIKVLSPNSIISNTVRTHLLISPLAKRFHVPLIWMAHDRTFPRLLLRFFIRYPNIIISCSKYVEHFYQSVSQRSDLLWKIIYPFVVDYPQIQPKKKKNIIGMIGNFIPWKGHDTFIEAAAEISKNYPQYQFMIVGNIYERKKKSEKYFEKCSQLVQKLHLDHILKIKTGIKNIFDEISEWEILVHCSKTPEPLGRVILEGMASGCAVIASNSGGIREIITDRVTGFLISPDKKSVVLSLKTLIENQDLKNTVAHHAFKKIKQEFTWEKILRTIKNIL